MPKQPAAPTTLLPLLILLIILSSPLTAAKRNKGGNQDKESPNCKFTWNNQPPSEQNSAPFRVTPAKTCPANEGCSLVSPGHETYLANVNASGLATSTVVDAVAETVPRDMIRGDGFNHSVRGSVENTYPMRAGQSGYLNVTIKRQCFTGTVEGCASDGGDGHGEDGTVVRVCAPIWEADGDSVRFLLKEWAVQNVSAEDVDKYSSDPYRGAEAEDDDSVDGVPVGIGEMARMNGGLLVGLVGLVAVIVI